MPFNVSIMEPRPSVTDGHRTSRSRPAVLALIMPVLMQR